MTGRTRRRFLAGAGAAAALPLIGAVVPTAAQAGDEDETLRSSVVLEQIAVFTYRQAAASGRLGASKAVARLFARQEQEHADALIEIMRKRGHSPPPAPTHTAEIPGLDTALRGGGRAIARFAVQVEERAVTAYYAAQGSLRDPDLLRTTASIMASEAQHLVVLRQSLGRTASPEAFVTGKDSRP